MISILEAKMEKIDRFLYRYRQTAAGERRQEYKRFQQAFHKCRDGYLKVKHEAIEEDRLTAPSYNVFSILSLERSEVRTHSALLATLLDPNGSHGQGFLFLETFLQHCACRYPDFPCCSGIRQGRWTINTEAFIPGGRLDIVIRSFDQSMLYVIENKVDAAESKAQLAWYGEWLAGQSTFYERWALIFLTPDGSPARTAGPFTTYPLSYREDITAWLTGCLTKIPALPVRETLRQYIETVKAL